MPFDSVQQANSPHRLGCLRAEIPGLTEHYQVEALTRTSIDTDTE